MRDIAGRRSGSLLSAARHSRPDERQPYAPRRRSRQRPAPISTDGDIDDGDFAAASNRYEVQGWKGGGIQFVEFRGEILEHAVVHELPENSPARIHTDQHTFAAVVQKRKWWDCLASFAGAPPEFQSFRFARSRALDDVLEGPAVYSTTGGCARPRLRHRVESESSRSWSGLGRRRNWGGCCTPTNVPIRKRLRPGTVFGPSMEL